MSAGEVPFSPAAQRRGRIKLLLLAAFFVAPVIAAYLLYLGGWAPGTTSNYGSFLAYPLTAAPLEPVVGETKSLEQLRGRWVMVSFDTPECDMRCDRKLYLMRQARIAQGEKMERIERLWLLTAPGAPAPGLVAVLDGTRVARLASAGAMSAFPAERSVTEHLYLIDPLGNVMMRWPADPDGTRVIRDLRRLLRYARF